MDELKYQVWMAILAAAVALHQLLIVLIQERRAGRRHKETLDSLRPPPPDDVKVVFDPDETPRNSACSKGGAHLWALADHEIIWRCGKCGTTFTDAK